MRRSPSNIHKTDPRLSLIRPEEKSLWNTTTKDLYERLNMKMDRIKNRDGKNVSPSLVKPSRMWITTEATWSRVQALHPATHWICSQLPPLKLFGYALYTANWYTSIQLGCFIHYVCMKFLRPVCSYWPWKHCWWRSQLRMQTFICTLRFHIFKNWTSCLILPAVSTHTVGIPGLFCRSQLVNKSLVTRTTSTAILQVLFTLLHPLSSTRGTNMDSWVT